MQQDPGLVLRNITIFLELRLDLRLIWFNTVNPQIVAGVFYLLRLHSAQAFIWGRLVLGAGLYFLLIIRLFRMFQKVPLI